MQQSGWFMGGLDRYYTTGFAEANAALADGEAAMKIEGTWWLPNGDVFWGPEAGNANEWDWAPVPARDGRTSFTIGVASMGVNAKTEHPDEVAAFLTHFFAPDSQATLLTGCSFAPAPIAIPAERLDVLEARHARLFTALSEASAANEYGYASWTFWPPKTETHLIEEIEKVWAGDVTAEEYLAEMQALFDEERAAGDALPIPVR
jgi:raffinose/stachyose/melibiose transport system substrate-binding protein